MSDLKVGDIVEHKDREGMLTVKMVQGKEVVVSSETMQLGVYTTDKLFRIPGQDYNYLRRIVLDTMAAVASDIGSSNLASERGRLAVARKLFAADVRRGTDMAQHLEQRVVSAITDAVKQDAIQAVLRQNPGPRAKGKPVACPDPEPVAITHCSPEESGTLVPGVTDDELALMCCDVADALAGAMGYAASIPAQTKPNMSALQRRITAWSTTRGHARKDQVWNMAKSVVNICRQAEVDDAIENVLEAIRQQEDPEDYI